MLLIIEAVNDLETDKLLVTYFIVFFSEIKYMIDGKQQVLSLGMDMQLEWLTLEDFQKHLDGEDENHVSTEPISSSE